MTNPVTTQESASRYRGEKVPINTVEMAAKAAIFDMGFMIMLLRYKSVVPIIFQAGWSSGEIIFQVIRHQLKICMYVP